MHDHGFIHVIVCFIKKFSLHVCVEISSMDNTVCVDHNFSRLLFNKKTISSYIEKCSIYIVVMVHLDTTSHPFAILHFHLVIVIHVSKTSFISQP